MCAGSSSSCAADPADASFDDSCGSLMSSTRRSPASSRLSGPTYVQGAVITTLSLPASVITSGTSVNVRSAVLLNAQREAAVERSRHGAGALVPLSCDFCRVGRAMCGSATCMWIRRISHRSILCRAAQST